MWGGGGRETWAYIIRKSEGVTYSHIAIPYRHGLGEQRDNDGFDPLPPPLAVLVVPFVDPLPFRDGIDKGDDGAGEGGGGGG